MIAMPRRSWTAAWSGASVIAVLAVTCVIVWSNLNQDASEDRDVGAFFAVLGGLVVTALWMPRLAGWALARRSRAVELRAELHMVMPIGRSLVGSTFVQLSDGSGGVWYQRIGWEPWLCEVRREFTVTARRSPIPGTGFLLSVPRRGVLMPAGGARRSAPMLGYLVPGAPSPRVRDRWPTAAVLVTVGTLVAGFGWRGEDPWGLLAGLDVAALLLCVWLWSGGTPIRWATLR